MALLPATTSSGIKEEERGLDKHSHVSGMGQSVFVDGRGRGVRRLSSDPSPPARVLRARSSSSTARWAGVAVKGIRSDLCNGAPAKRKRDVLLELAHEHVHQHSKTKEEKEDEERDKLKDQSSVTGLQYGYGREPHRLLLRDRLTAEVEPRTQSVRESKVSE